MSTPSFEDSSFPALVSISCSASVIRFVYVKRKEKTGIVDQLKVVLESFWTNCSMYVSQSKPLA